MLLKSAVCWAGPALPAISQLGGDQSTKALVNGRFEISDVALGPRRGDGDDLAPSPGGHQLRRPQGPLMQAHDVGAEGPLPLGRADVLDGHKLYDSTP